MASPALLTALFIASCKGDNPSGPGPAPSASVPASASGLPAPKDGEGPRPKDEEVRPAYPVTNAPPDPLADKLCAALHTLPAARKAQCCGASGPGPTLQSECTRVLSYALREKAITIDAAAVDRCAAAMAKAHEACDWVAPLLPSAPDECRGIVTGTLAEGATCRSSLECAGNFHCEGVGPTTLGKCAPMRPAGHACAVGVDPLASVTRQEPVEAQHPECTGICFGRRCVDPLPVGGECKSHVICGPSRHCKAGRCADGPLPSAGEPCSGGECGGLARCIDDKCALPKKEGEECKRDSECRSACVLKAGTTSGTCGMRCKNALGF